MDTGNIIIARLAKIFHKGQKEYNKKDK